MGVYSLTNVPTAQSKLEIKGFVEGELVYVLCCEKDSLGRDGRSSGMTSTFVGDHMLAKPAELRRMYADDLANAVRLGRDAGYEQAKAELRDWLKAPR